MSAQQDRRGSAARDAGRTERRRQVRGLLMLALAVFLFTLLRAARHGGLGPGWWRLW